MPSTRPLTLTRRRVEIRSTRTEEAKELAGREPQKQRPDGVPPAARAAATDRAAQPLQHLVRHACEREQQCVATLVRDKGLPQTR